MVGAGPLRALYAQPHQGVAPAAALVERRRSHLHFQQMLRPGSLKKTSHIHCCTWESCASPKAILLDIGLQGEFLRAGFLKDHIAQYKYKCCVVSACLSAHAG